MTRIDIFLALLIMVSALAVVTARHEARNLFLELQRVQKVGRDLEVEWHRLLLKQASWAMYHRVEAIANQRLGMSHPEVARIRVLHEGAGLNGGAVSASGSDLAGRAQ